MSPILRPAYHFLPLANWMNDPNGLIQHNGVWHLFYQYNPNGAFWGTMHWGHAASGDLVHWEHLPIALAPEPDGPDTDGCYSGATVVHEGVPTIVYTGVRDDAQLPCLAVSGDPGLVAWRKDPENPVIRSRPTDLPTTIFRDHTLWREDGSWLMGIGSGIEGRGGAVLLYRSDDLRSWDYLHPFAVEDPALNRGGEIVSTGWECPDVFFLDGHPVLMACEWDGSPISVAYWTGACADRRFEATRKGLVDPSTAFYAPQSTTDDRGRRVMFGWLREQRTSDAQLAAGWSGVMTLPRIVSLQKDGSLAFTVAAEVDALRGRCTDLEPRPGLIALPGMPPHRMELDIVASGDMEIEVCRSVSGDERTVVAWDGVRGVLSLDTTRSSLSPEATGEVASARVPLSAGEALSLRVFVDGSVIEVYANDRVAISGRVYPTQELDSRIRVEAAEGVVRSLHVWEMLDQAP